MDLADHELEALEQLIYCTEQGSDQSGTPQVRNRYFEVYVYIYGLNFIRLNGVNASIIALLKVTINTKQPYAEVPSSSESRSCDQVHYF